MLDPWIIEEIFRREEQNREQGRGRAELPLESPRYRDSIPWKPDGRDNESERGVFIIDI
ncbi:MAG: hypothetical protein Tsb0020_32190 [Haliangiales bacterium]